VPFRLQGVESVLRISWQHRTEKSEKETKRQRECFGAGKDDRDHRVKTDNLECGTLRVTEDDSKEQNTATTGSNNCIKT